MKKKIISYAITNISTEYIEKSANYTVAKKNRKSLYIKWGTLAACFALILTLSIPMALHMLNPDDTPDNIGTNHPFTVENLNRPYRDFTIVDADMDVAWQWKYLTVFEKYLSVDIDGVHFIRLGEEINTSVIGEKIGKYQAVGYNDPYETPEGGYREEFDAYAIENISTDRMVALKMEDNYYCFISDAARSRLHEATWGDVLDGYGLSNAIKFKNFSQYTNGQETKYFSLKDDYYIWEVLTSCKNAPSVDPTEFVKGNYYSFTVTSDVFGIYKKAFYVTENGYIWTNMLEVECVYRIGKEVAESIIAYALDNSETAKREPYHQTVVGTITEITNEYILIDDSVLCKDANDGITFKIMLNDLRINRYVDDGRISVGDIVQVVYKGSINTTSGYVVDSAVSASQVAIRDGIVEKAE